MRSIKVTIDNEKNLALAKDLLNAMKFVVEVEDIVEDELDWSPELISELERRHKEMMDNPDLGYTLEEVRKKIKNKYGF